MCVLIVSMTFMHMTPYMVCVFVCSFFNKRWINCNCNNIFFYCSVKKLFYIVQGSTPAIKVANLDGTGVQVVLSDKLVQPTAITLDLTTKKIYFADNRLNYIDFCDYDGTHRHQLIVDTHVRNKPLMWIYICFNATNDIAN